MAFFIFFNTTLMVYSFSDIAYLAWVNFLETEKSDLDPSSLEWVIQGLIDNPSTQQISKQVASENGGSIPAWPGIVLQPDTVDGQALVGCPNGYGTAFLLTTHLVFKGKTIKEVYLFDDENTDTCMAFSFGALAAQAREIDAVSASDSSGESSPWDNAAFNFYEDFTDDEDETSLRSSTPSIMSRLDSSADSVFSFSWRSSTSGLSSNLPEEIPTAMHSALESHAGDWKDSEDEDFEFSDILGSPSGEELASAPEDRDWTTVRSLTIVHLVPDCIC